MSRPGADFVNRCPCSVPGTGSREPSTEQTWSPGNPASSGVGHLQQPHSIPTRSVHGAHLSPGSDHTRTIPSPGSGTHASGVLAHQGPACCQLPPTHTRVLKLCCQCSPTHTHCPQSLLVRLTCLHYPRCGAKAHNHSLPPSLASLFPSSSFPPPSCMLDQQDTQPLNRGGIRNSAISQAAGSRNASAMSWPSASRGAPPAACGTPRSLPEGRPMSVAAGSNSIPLGPWSGQVAGMPG